MPSLKCLRCGKCCFFVIDGISHKCRFLILLKSGKTCCKIYRIRKTLAKLNKPLHIYPNVLCLTREQQIKLTNQEYDYCPYNVLVVKPDSKDKSE